MWDVLLAGAALGSLLWGLINSVENRELRDKLAKFDRVKGAKGRFVSTRPKTAEEVFWDNGGNHGLPN